MTYIYPNEVIAPDVWRRDAFTLKIIVQTRAEWGFPHLVSFPQPQTGFMSLDEVKEVMPDLHGRWTAVFGIDINLFFVDDRDAVVAKLTFCDLG